MKTQIGRINAMTPGPFLTLILFSRSRRARTAGNMRALVRASLVLVTIILGLGSLTPVAAKANWLSGSIWSESSTECTAGGDFHQQTRFRFYGDTSSAVACASGAATANAQASATWGWGGGDAGGNGINGGKYSRDPGTFTTSSASSSIFGVDFQVFPDHALLTGGSSIVGNATNELGAFLFTGDPADFANLGPVNIPDLIALGLISPSDVLFNLFGDQIPSTFSNLDVVFPFTLTPDQEKEVVFIGWTNGESTPAPEPSSLLLLGSGLLGFGRVLRKRMIT